ncbi:hypothetical protein BC629DRAFT_1719649 [Irpex lacteus]|nr:hypothetical protein BC629DRAFT_1719649 [Irpex lacteus]
MSDAAAKQWDDNINRRLFDLVHSQANYEKLGVLWLLASFIITSSQRRRRRQPRIKAELFRFFNYAKSLLPNPDVNVMLPASKTLGKISRIGGAAFADMSRHAGVLILIELARNNPVHFHGHIGLVFEKILVPLRDPRVMVGESAAELLAACLSIVTQRERQPRDNGKNPYLRKILSDAQNGLKTYMIHLRSRMLLYIRLSLFNFRSG